MSLWRSRVFLYCLAADAVFIVVYIALRRAEQAGIAEMHSMLNLESESSFPSFFIYFQWLAMSILLFLAARRSGGVAAAAFGLFGTRLFLDDAAQIHEQLGELVASALDLTGVSGVPPQVIGELIVLAGLGVFALTCIVVAWTHPDGVGRPAIAAFSLLAALLAAFGIGFDVVHAMVPVRMQWVYGTVEDGGEMILATAMLALTAQIAA